MNKDEIERNTERRLLESFKRCLPEHLKPDFAGYEAKESMERELYDGLVGMYKIALKITAYSMTQSELEAKSNAKQLIKKYEDSLK